jgi:hypothetical protein
MIELLRGGVRPGAGSLDKNTRGTRSSRSAAPENRTSDPSPQGVADTFERHDCIGSRKQPPFPIQLQRVPHGSEKTRECNIVRRRGFHRSSEIDMSPST